ncbi:MAG: hypothetical protein MZV49_03060 [Rhodopseudomonas palustris]|nr:hypothetical protein [Rhodopseudomonas palustris]
MTKRTPVPAVPGLPRLRRERPGRRPGRGLAPAPRPVEVRAHVSGGGRFLDDLQLEDFDLLEDGRPQTAPLPDARPRRQRRRGRGPDAVAGPPRAELHPSLPGRRLGPQARRRRRPSLRRRPQARRRRRPSSPRSSPTSSRRTPWPPAPRRTCPEEHGRGPAEGHLPRRRRIPEPRQRAQAPGPGDRGRRRHVHDVQRGSARSDSSTESGTFSLDMQIDRYRQSLMKLDAMRLVGESEPPGLRRLAQGRPGPEDRGPVLPARIPPRDQRVGHERPDEPLPGQPRHPGQPHGPVPVLQAREDLRRRGQGRQRPSPTPASTSASSSWRRRASASTGRR